MKPLGMKGWPFIVQLLDAFGGSRAMGVCGKLQSLRTFKMLLFRILKRCEKKGTLAVFSRVGIVRSCQKISKTMAPGSLSLKIQGLE